MKFESDRQCASEHGNAREQSPEDLKGPISNLNAQDLPGQGKDARAPEGLGRRAFLGRIGAGGAATMALGLTSFAVAQTVGEPADLAPDNGKKRREDAYKVRKDAANIAKHRPIPDHPNNGEEASYPYIANFTKGLPHNGLGEVDPVSYGRLLTAVASEKVSDFEAIPLGGVRKLRNPLSGKAFDLEGPDCNQLAIRPAPRIDQAENSGEMGELYWMSLTRDVAFTQYGSDTTIADACSDLNDFSDFRGPKASGSVTPATIFRGNTPGDVAGPYVSQFLLRDVPYGTLTIVQRQKTVLPNIDFATSYGSWLDLQRGLNPSASDMFDATPRYIRNGRDLAAYVHFDALYEAYLNACLILLGLGAPFDAGNPYNSFAKMDSFTTYGGPHILSLVTEVATRALKGVWFQKWFIHRRLRPEEFGGRIHNHLTGAATYPINGEILNSDAVARTYSAHGSYLLAQAFPEGAPLHPAYGSGHATVAGACVTILKAWFDESFVIPNPVVSSADGLSLDPYVGPGAGSLTVGGELNKVAANIASGRNFGGIHWRTDFSEAFKLGESIAIGILEEQAITYKEGGSFSLTKFDGTTVTVGAVGTHLAYVTPSNQFGSVGSPR